jgi:hypothetical protein
MKPTRALLLGLALSSCASTVLVEVPPRMLLDREKTIGIVSFDVQGGGADARDVSSRFLAALHQAQPGVAVVELGSVAEVLGAVGKDRMDGEAVQEIGRKFEVDAVILGALEMKESSPEVDVDLQDFRLGSVTAQVRLDGSLEAKLVNTDRGATLWTGSSARWIDLARVSGSGPGQGSVRIQDRDRQVELLVSDMVQEASSDFRPTWRREPAP